MPRPLGPSVGGILLSILCSRGYVLFVGHRDALGRHMHINVLEGRPDTKA